MVLVVKRTGRLVNGNLTRRPVRIFKEAVF